MTVWDTSRLYLWNVGGATLRIDLQPGPEFIDLFAESILLHPFEQDTIFLCCIITGEFCGCRVAEYRGRTYIASYYTSGAPLSGHPISVPGFSDTLPPGRSSRCIRQANSEGLYTIAHFIAEKDSDDRSRQAAALYSVQFNIFTRSFSYLWHQIERLGVGVAPDIEYLWVWGDILMFVMLPGFWGAFHRRIRANGLEGIQTDIPDSGAWLAGIRGNKWLARPGDFSGHERHKDKPQFDFMLSVRQEDLGQEPLPDHSQTFQFVGVDEHYIVLWLHRRMVVVDWGS